MMLSLRMRFLNNGLLVVLTVSMILYTETIKAVKTSRPANISVISDSIVCTVNNIPITDYQIKQFRTMISTLWPTSHHISDEHVVEFIIKILVQEEYMTKILTLQPQMTKYIQVSSLEIVEALRRMASGYGLTLKQMLTLLQEQKVYIKNLIRFIIAEIGYSKAINIVCGNKIAFSQQDKAYIKQKARIMQTQPLILMEKMTFIGNGSRARAFYALQQLKGSKRVEFNVVATSADTSTKPAFVIGSELSGDEKAVIQKMVHTKSDNIHMIQHGNNHSIIHVLHSRSPAQKTEKAFVMGRFIVPIDTKKASEAQLVPFLQLLSEIIVGKSINEKLIDKATGNSESATSGVFDGASSVLSAHSIPSVVIPYETVQLYTLPSQIRELVESTEVGVVSAPIITPVGIVMIAIKKIVDVPAHIPSENELAMQMQTRRLNSLAANILESMIGSAIVVYYKKMEKPAAQSVKKSGGV